MNEIWKTLPGFNGHYKLSNLGRVLRIARMVKRAESSDFYIEKMFMTLSDGGKKNQGRWVTLRDNGKCRNMKISKLLRETFTEGELCSSF